MSVSDSSCLLAFVVPENPDRSVNQSVCGRITFYEIIAARASRFLVLSSALLFDRHGSSPRQNCPLVNN